MEGAKFHMAERLRFFHKNYKNHKKVLYCKISSTSYILRVYIVNYTLLSLLLFHYHLTHACVGLNIVLSI